MNPVMEQFFGTRGLTLTHRAELVVPLLPRDAGLFIQYLHIEMWQCFINGHDHAAIVTASALLEHAIKDAIFFDAHLQADKVFDRSTWDKIDGLELGQAIQYARSRGIITKEEKKRLFAFKDQIRNKWMHGETPAEVKATCIPEIVEANYRTGEVKKVRVDLGDNAMFQKIGRILADREMAPNVVDFVDRIVRELNTINEEKLLRWREAKGDTPPTKEQVDRVLENIRQQFGENALNGLSGFMGHAPPFAPSHPGTDAAREGTK